MDGNHANQKKYSMARKAAVATATSAETEPKAPGRTRRSPRRNDLEGLFGDGDGELEPISRSPYKDTRVGFLMHDISRLRRSAFDNIMKQIGVTRAQWWVIAHLSRHDGMMQVQLAELLDIGKASLGNLVERLEKGGWVVRRSDPGDARLRRVYLTRKARQLIDHIHDIEFNFNEESLAGLDRDQRDNLLSALQLIKDNLKSMLRDQSSNAA